MMILIHGTHVVRAANVPGIRRYSCIFSFLPTVLYDKRLFAGGVKWLCSTHSGVHMQFEYQYITARMYKSFFRRIDTSNRGFSLARSGCCTLQLVGSIIYWYRSITAGLVAGGTEKTELRCIVIQYLFIRFLGLTFFPIGGPCFLGSTFVTQKCLCFLAQYCFLFSIRRRPLFSSVGGVFLFSYRSTFLCSLGCESSRVEFFFFIIPPVFGIILRTYVIPLKCKTRHDLENSTQGNPAPPYAGSQVSGK